MPELQSRVQNLDGRVVIIDPSFDRNPNPVWDVPTLDQIKAQKRISDWEKKKKALEYQGKFRSPSLAMELRFKTSLAYLQPFVETGVALGIYTDRLVRLFS